VVLLGLSMGGTLVLDVGSTERVAGVVTINAQILDRGGVVVKLAPLIEKLVPLAPASAAGLTKNDIKKGGDEKAYEWVAAAAGNSLVRALPEVRGRLRQLACPLLVIYSRDDHSVPPDNSKALPGLVGSTNVTVVELENSYHVATLDHDLPLIAERVAMFAENLPK
jgi:carboxylesterase